MIIIWNDKQEIFNFQEYLAMEFEMRTSVDSSII